MKDCTEVTERLLYFAQLVGAYKAMPEADRQELHEWEKQNVNGEGLVGSSNWQGWLKYGIK